MLLEEHLVNEDPQTLAGRGAAERVTNFDQVDNLMLQIPIETL